MHLHGPDDPLVDEPPEPSLLGIADTLAQIQRAGSFCASGTHPAPAGGFAVDGFGTVPTPVIPIVAEALLPLTTAAPYGRGGDTLVDPSVRSCRQLGAEQIDLDTPAWGTALDEIAARAAQELGVDGQVHAQLYKLLLYRAGDFFLPHRDSEKEDGMFGTLVVVLPSEFSGGELVVSHADSQRTLGLRPDSPDQLTWAAFYADCLHELRALDSGLRIVLVFNLVRDGPAVEPPDHGPVEVRLRRQLGEWVSAGQPPMLCYALEHRYTPAELSWRNLKGVDQARAATLARAASAEGLRVRLAMVSIEEQWSAMESFDYDHRHDRYAPEPEPGPDEVELFDLFELVRAVEHWRDEEDRALDLPALDFDLSDVIPAGALTAEEPDDFHYMEATGNEGATVERTYRRASVVVWSPRDDTAVLAKGGSRALLSALADLLRQPAPDADKVEQLALAVVPFVSQDHSPSLALLLDLAADQDLVTVVDAWLQAHPPARVLQPELGPPLGRALSRLPADAAGRALADLVSRGDWNSLGDHAHVVGTVHQLGVLPAATWTRALDVLLARFQDGPVPPEDSRWWQPKPLEPGALAALLRLTVQLRPERSETLLDRARDWPQLIGFDAVVVPATVDVVGSQGPQPALEPWVAHVRSILQPRLDDPPTPPLDFVRAPPTGCSCDDCATLAAFMGDATRDRVQLPLNKQRRRHLHSVVEQQLDATTHTVRQGSPYKLVVTKNLATYERAMAQARSDATVVAVLLDAGC